MANGKFVRYSADEIARLRDTDMIDFLSRNYGFDFRREGRSYRCSQHNSLVVDGDRKRWFWNSQGVGGNNVIDWFKSIERMDFKECCRLLLGDKDDNNDAKLIRTSSTVQKKPVEKQSNEEKAEFVAPKKHEGGMYTRVYSYLTKSRCIDADIVQRLFKEGTIYQEAEYGNCVFAGYDENGILRFAERRSTSTFKRYDTNGKEIKYRPNVKGSDKRYSFHLDADEKTDCVYVFEAPIDLLSHATLTNIKARDKSAYRKNNRLSLSGAASDIALNAYLEKHKEIKKIVFCLDNDQAGHKNMEKFTNIYTQKGYTCISTPVDYGKDYNDLLCEVTRRINQHRKTKESDNIKQSGSNVAADSDSDDDLISTSALRR